MSWLKQHTLLILNFGVLGLFLWLTISFVVLAVAERNQAKQLSSSLDAQSAIYNAAQAFASQQENAYRVSRVIGSDPLFKHIDSRNDNSELSIALDTKTELVEQHINRNEFNARIRSSRESILELDATLTSQMSVISQNARKTFAGLPMQESEFQQLGSVDRDLSSGMALLSGSLSYLPNRNSAQVSVLQSMLAIATRLRLDLSHLQLEFWKYAGTADEGQQTLSPHLLKINDTILIQFDSMALLSNSAVVDSQRLRTAHTLKTGYLSAVSNGHALFAQPYSVGGAAQSLSSNDSLIEVVNRIDLIASAAISDLSSLANAQLQRATRNLLIDLVLMGMCLLIASTLFIFNRRTNFLAYKDHLTGLSNRASLEFCLTKLNAPNSNAMHALIFIDLDRFKAVNDNYGHDIGDELIKVVGARLKLFSGSNAVVARHGGDEFAVLIRNIESERHAMVLANQLLKSIREDIVIEHHVLKVGASAGVSLSPIDGDSGLVLLRNADIAMYQCKVNKQEEACRFDSAAAKNYQSRLDIEIALKDALKKGEFQLFYQPKVCTRTGTVYSVEALLRWVHSEWGIVSPGQFIPVAEDMGLMGQIGNWVVAQACEQISEFRQQTNLDISVAVNVSAQQFGEDGFEEHVSSVLHANKHQHALLELEVTESVLMDDAERVISVLKNFRKEGIKIAIDDFGTGFSSLQYLQKLPLDVLKIDRAFVLAIDSANPANSVAYCIVQLAKLFNLETVAEGVETEEQDNNIRSLGVDHIQGYRYSKPVPVEQLADAIDNISNTFGSDSQHGESHAA